MNNMTTPVNHKTSWLLCLAILFAVFSSNLVQASQFERLFTTVEQRNYIDAERERAKAPEKGQQKYEKQYNRIVFDALLKTEKGHNVWINGFLVSERQKINGIVIDPRQFNAGFLTIHTAHGYRKIALGQSYWIDEDKVLEAYEQPKPKE